MRRDVTDVVSLQKAIFVVVESAMTKMVCLMQNGNLLWLMYCLFRGQKQSSSMGTVGKGRGSRTRSLAETVMKLFKSKLIEDFQEVNERERIKFMLRR